MICTVQERKELSKAVPGAEKLQKIPECNGNITQVQIN
jgi:hypothetical protein